jgi:hypothetical protein
MEGTAAHVVASELIHGRIVTEGTLAPNGIAVTDEMADGAEMYADVIPHEMLEPIMLCHVEERVKIPRIHPDCWGTPDVWWLKDQTIHLVDYKFGHGYVDEFENWQLMAYGCGVLDYLNMNDATTWFEFTIVQPRCFHRDGSVRTWRVLASAIREFVKLMSHVTKLVSERPSEAQCHTGEWCRHCSALHACEAAQLGGFNVMQFIRSPIPADMPIEAKSIYLQKIKQAMELIKAIDVGLEEELEAAIRGGTNVPGFELKPGRGSTVWSKSYAEVTALGDMLGTNLRKDGLITPKQASDALKKIGLDGNVISEYSEHKSGSLKLVQSDSSKLRRIFSTQQPQGVIA